MLQKIRDNTQSLGFKILVGAIIIVLTVFGFGAFNLFLNPNPDVASVNGEGITQAELAQETERARARVLGQMGENADPSLVDRLALQGQVLEQMIQRMLLVQTTEDLGISTSQQRGDQALIDNPSFQADGQFDRDIYIATLRRAGFTPAMFAAETRKDLAIQQMQDGIVDSVAIPSWQLRQVAALLHQRRDLAYLPLRQEDYVARVEVSDEEIEQHYLDNRSAYFTEENVDLDYVVLNWQTLLDDPDVEVTDDDLRTRYEDNKAAHVADERRKAAHILIGITDERTDDEALALAEDIRAQLDAGGDFAALADTYSDDPGSKATGGDLGFASRSTYVAPFGDALWAMAEGDVSDPVKTEFGYHIIRLDEIEAGQYPEFEAQREQLAATLKEEGAKAIFVERKRELDGLAFEQNDSLEGLVERFGLTVQQVDGVTRETGEGPFVNADARDTAFSDDVVIQGFNSPVIELSEHEALVLRLRERHEPRQLDLEEVSDGIRAVLADDKARLAIEADLATGLEALQGDASAAEVAEDLGGEWQRYTLAGRSEPSVPREVLEAAFDTAVSGGRQVTTATLPGGEGQALVTVTRVVDGDLSRLTDQQADAVQQFAESRLANLDFGGLLESRRNDASISRPDS